MFNKKLSDQFSKGLLDEVKKVMKKKEKEAPETEAPESSCEEYSPVKVAGDTRQIQARIHGAKTSGTLKNKPATQYKKDGTLYKEGVVPTNDMPTQKDRQTAAKVADLLAKEKKVKKVAEGSDLPWKEDPKNPSHKVGVHKDQYGNVIKNVAKHLAKKAMKANEEVEQINEIGDTPAGKRALGRYIKDRRGSILGSGMEMQKQNADRSTTDKQRKDVGRKASNAFTGVSRAVDRLTKEEVEIDEATLKSNKDGESGSRGATFSSKSPNSYKVIGKDGEHLATAHSAKDPKYGGRTTHWSVTWHKAKHKDHPGSFQYMHQLKKHVKELEEEAEIHEVAPAGAKYERMIKHIKKGYAKDGKLTDQEKSIAYATAWKAKKANEAVGDVTVKKLSPADAFKKNTGQDTKPTSVPKDPKTGKTLYQKVTSEEAEQVDEALDSMSDARVKYHATKNFPHGKYSSKEIDAEHKRRMKAVPNYHSVKASLGEEAEQIDEISAKTKSSYAAKASEYIMNKAHSMKPDEVKKWNRRQKGMEMLKKEEAEQIEETFLTPNMHAELKNMPKDAVKRHHDVYMATAKNFKKNGSHALAAAAEGAAREIKRRYMSEDVEQIDELSDATLKSYSKKALDQSKTLTGDQKVKRQVGARNAIDRLGNNTLAKEDTEQFEQDAMNLSNEEFEAKWLTPQVNELDEAFEALTEGRPKVMIQHPWDKNRKLHPVKDKDIIAKLREKGYTNLGDRPSTENPINQLRKASTSMTGGHHVTLHTGEKHHVTNAQASRILDKHAGMKTAKEKLDYQDKLRDKEFLQKEAGK